MLIERINTIKRSGESNGDGGDQYTGLDRFGRVVDQRWLVASSGTATDRFKYGYDRDGNRLYRTNELNHSFDELYHANGASNGYDSLNQLAAFARGTLSDTNSDGIPDTVASPSHSQSWTPDAAGNFSSITTDGTAVTRTNNKQNEVTQVGSSTLGFDANGNTTTDDNGKLLVYDAWNRLVAYKNGATTLESMQYDGLNRRIVVNPGTATDLYYSSDWRMLEEQVGGVSKVQYVWSPVYLDALILRDRDADGNSANGLEERLYVQQDANWNVTALLNTSGTVVERYAYDPYGYVAAFLNASWGTLSGSAYAWLYLHQGGRFDGISNLYYFRNRDYSPTLGRWLRVDPIGFIGGDINLYRAYFDAPTDYRDSTGLAVCFMGIMVKTKGPSFAANTPGTPPEFRQLGPYGDRTKAKFAFEVVVWAKVSDGDKITDADVNQKVHSFVMFTSSIISPNASAGVSTGRPEIGGRYTDISADEALKWMDMASNAAYYLAGERTPNNKASYDALFGKAGQDSVAHTGKGGVFVPNAQRRSRTIWSNDNVIKWIDVPGPDDNLAGLYDYNATLLAFQVTAVDKGGATNGKKIVARFLIGWTATTENRVWNVDGFALPPFLQKMGFELWSDKE